MTAELKEQIVDAALSYMVDKEISQNALAAKTGINEGYLSTMLRGITHTVVGDKKVPIADKWFIKLADAIGISVEKTYWETVPTMQFLEVVSTLEAVKTNGNTCMLIGGTGCGKTYSVDTFCRKHPAHTFKITVNQLYKISDIIDDLLQPLGIEKIGSHAYKLGRIIAKLRTLKQSGAKPIIILDEFENAKLPLIKTIKALYDGVASYCGIALVATEQLTTRLTYMRIRNKEGVPQFYRRFKAGCRHIAPVDKQQSFALFFDKTGVEDKGLRKLLLEIADNFGELNDYLEPALKEADRAATPLTEDLFRRLYNMPKY